jgi:hypothetical protein
MHLNAPDAVNLTASQLKAHLLGHSIARKTSDIVIKTSTIIRYLRSYAYSCTLFDMIRQEGDGRRTS